VFFVSVDTYAEDKAYKACAGPLHVCWWASVPAQAQLRISRKPHGSLGTGGAGPDVWQTASGLTPDKKSRRV